MTDSFSSRITRASLAAFGPKANDNTSGDARPVGVRKIAGLADHVQRCLEFFERAHSAWPEFRARKPRPQAPNALRTHTKKPSGLSKTGSK